MNDDERWLEIAGLILDGKPVEWDTIPSGRASNAPSADALRVIADVADLHRAPTGEPVRQWGTLAIEEQIGHGAFGDVYRARDTALDRDVALKLIDYTSSTIGPDEGRLLARVRHSNVVTVHGAAIHDGRYGIWMEFIRGRTLAAVVREDGPLAAEDVTAIGIDVCRALTAVHESGLLHGDIKPQNVMREDGGRIVVMDFGTGRVVTDSAAGRGLAGTPLYLAPEVLTGAAPDVRADVYGTGVLLYYLLTGAHPVEGDTLDGVRAAHDAGARTPLRSRRPEIRRPLAAIIERAIAVEPSDRFESAAAFERALRESSAKRSRTFTRRDAALFAVGVMIVVLGGGWLLSRIPQPNPRPKNLAPPTVPIHQQLTFVGDALLPGISRDGKFLVYVKPTAGSTKGTVIVQDITSGQAFPVFEGERLQTPVWSNDGSELLISTLNGVTGNGMTMIVPRLGGRGRRVGPGFYWRSWSPDDARFAGIDGEKRILIVDKQTNRMTSIPVTGSFDHLYAVDWSPTGDLLLFGTVERRRYAIWTIRVDGSHQEKVAESSGIFAPHWSPKGDAIYYLTGGLVKDLMKLPVSVSTGKATGSSVAILTGLQVGPVFSISGDGQQLVYTRAVDRNNLWLASTKRSGAAAPDVKQLTSGTIRDQVGKISPDGRLIAFVRSNANGTNLFVMPVGGGPPEQITTLNSAIVSPVWSPDGQAIAFGTVERGQSHLWRVSATGGPPRSLGQTRYGGGFIAWAPNPNVVYKESGDGLLSVVDSTTGKDWPLVEDNYGGHLAGAWTSPDVRRVAVYQNSDLHTGIWLIPLSRTSEGTLLTSLSKGFGTISQAVDASTLRGRDVMLVAHVKTKVSGLGNQGQCWLRVDRPNHQRGFFDDMHDRPVQSRSWKKVTIAGRVDGDAERVAIGCSLTGTGKIWVADIRLEWKNTAGHWETMAIKNPGFEEGSDHVRPTGWDTTGFGYLYQNTDVGRYSGHHSLIIKSTYVVGDFYPLGWSADGTSVYASNAEHRAQLVIIRVDTGELKRFVTLPLGEGVSFGGWAISQDGQHVVYGAHQSQSDVWIARNFDSGR